MRGCQIWVENPEKEAVIWILLGVVDGGWCGSAYLPTWFNPNNPNHHKMRFSSRLSPAAAGALLSPASARVTLDTARSCSGAVEWWKLNVSDQGPLSSITIAFIRAQTFPIRPCQKCLTLILYWVEPFYWYHMQRSAFRSVHGQFRKLSRHDTCKSRHK